MDETSNAATNDFTISIKINGAIKPLIILLTGKFAQPAFIPKNSAIRRGQIAPGMYKSMEASKVKKEVAKKLVTWRSRAKPAT